MKKYAFLLMGNYDTEKDIATFKSENMTTYICTVKNFEEAKEKILELKEIGIGAIETCGAFSEDNINELAKILNNTTGIARVVATEDQGELLGKFFGD